ncbi:molybdenum cofactor biosynthesis protein B [Baaleninema sp.]|uniref:molybdenum cofactor biosynthesis protein B n=1 Tax=Baaleninema sp. TaxID=3101197 RepID=UPI003D018074
MAGIDESRAFLAVNIAVLTVSDTRTFETDKSGQVLTSAIAEAGHHLVDRAIVSDDCEAIVDRLKTWIANREIDVIITTGGTGITGRDVTPEAFQQVCEKDIPGFGELFRHLSYRKIGVAALPSRATAGVAGGTYLFALPGSSGACSDGWNEILRWQLDSRYRPCNLVSLMPRLSEK